MKEALPAEGVVDAALALLGAGKVDDAREFLLDEGYIKRLVPEIQAAYMELIPIHPTLRAMLEEVYPGLDDPDPKVRFDTASRLSRDFSKATLRDNVRWMRDPRASQPLIDAALAPDPKVAGRAVLALARLVTKYFPDQRALPAFRSALSRPEQLIRSNAIAGIGGLRQEKALGLLADVFDQGTADDRGNIAATIAGLAFETPYSQLQHPLEWSEAGKKLWRSKMIALLGDPSAALRRQAANALNFLGDPEAIPALQAARRVEPEDDTKYYAAYYMDEAIAALQKKLPQAGGG